MTIKEKFYIKKSAGAKSTVLKNLFKALYSGKLGKLENSTIDISNQLLNPVKNPNRSTKLITATLDQKPIAQSIFGKPIVESNIIKTISSKSPDTLKNIKSKNIKIGDLDQLSFRFQKQNPNTINKLIEFSKK